jgi:hypothetical protein
MRPLIPYLVRIPTNEDLPLQNWVIDGLPRTSGKRERKFFRNREDAERELGKIKKKLRKEGERALLISDAQRIEASEAAQRLAPLGVSLKDAVDFYMHASSAIGLHGPSGDHGIS